METSQIPHGSNKYAVLCTFMHFYVFYENYRNFTKIVHFFEKMPKLFRFYPNRLTCRVFILAHFALFCPIIIDRNVSRVPTATVCSQILLHFPFLAIMGAKIADRAALSSIAQDASARKGLSILALVANQN